MGGRLTPETAAALSLHVRGWERRLPEAWHPFAEQWAAGLVRSELPLKPVGIFPVLDGDGDSHLFKAFDGITPADVRVVVLGQDPYPNKAEATGRAFEQGNLRSFRASGPSMTRSLNMMLRRMVEATVGEGAVIKGVSWRKLLSHPSLSVDSPAQVFDHLTAEGVLLLNASLTIPEGASRTNNGHLPAHLEFWRPFIQAVTLGLMERPDGGPVFLLMGKPSRDLFDQMTGPDLRRRARMVRTSHPSASSFPQPPNPFVCVNEQLKAANQRPVKWLQVAS